MLSAPSSHSITQHTIVLDLDETLVHTFTDIELAKEFGIFDDPELRSRSYTMELVDVSLEKGTGQKIFLWGVVRPHVKEFLAFCFSYFKIVGVWSAGKKDYVEMVVELLFRDIKPPNFVYTYDDCVKEGENYYKPLHKLFKEMNLNLYIKPGNIFMLDDRLDVCKHNPQNVIVAQPYSPNTLEEIKAKDDFLEKLMIWFRTPEVRYSYDVGRLGKRWNCFMSKLGI